MPTVVERLTVGVDTGGLKASVAGQVQQLVQAVELGAALIDSPPTSVQDFVGRIAGLEGPSFSIDGAVPVAFSGALDALPADLGSLTGGAADELGRFTGLIETGLMPLLSKAVTAASSLEALVSIDLRCPPAGGARTDRGGGSGSGTGTGEEGEATTGAERFQIASNQLAQIDGLLAQLPDPVTVGSLLDLLFTFARGSRSNRFGDFNFPLLDDVIEPLQTCSQWSAMTPAEVGTHIQASLEALRDRVNGAAAGVVDALTTEVATLETPLRRPDLDSFAQSYLAALSDLQTAVGAADLATIGTRTADLDTTIGGFETLRGTMQADFTALVPGLRRRLLASPAAMFDSLAHLVVALEPVNPAAALTQGMIPPSPPDAEAVQQFREVLSPITNLVQDLVEVLDFSSIESEVAAVATEAQGIAAAVSAALTDVALDVRAAFQEVSAAVVGADADDFADDLRSQITAAGNAVEAALVDGFAPLRDGLDDAVQALSDALDAFDPLAVVTALQDVVQAIADVLTSPEVYGAIDAVRNAIQQIADTLQNLSFAPVTDEVIALIETMTEGLRALGDTDLNDATKGLLSTALAVLPDDLRPVTDPLIDDFDQLVESGPVQLLERVREKPQEVLNHVRNFEPRLLIGSALTDPYRELLDKAESFRPSSLVALANQEFETQKRRLKEQAGPAKALQPVVRAFDDLLARIDQYSPAAVLEPFEEQVEATIRSVVDASPVDDVFDVVNRAFDTIQGIVDTIENAIAVLTRLEAALTGLADSSGQIDAWRDALLDKVEAIPDLTGVTAAKASLDTAIDASRHADLVARYDGALTAIEAEMVALNPAQRLNAMVNTHQQLRAAATALADSPERTVLFAVLDRFDPLNPSHTGPLRAAAELHQAITRTRDTLTELGPQWTEVIHDPDGCLLDIRGTALNVAALRQAVADELEPDLGPVRLLFAQLEFAGPPVGGLLGLLTDLIDDLTSSFAVILTGPASLQTIANAVQQVVDTLRNIDLSVLRLALDEVFRSVRDQIATLGPRPLVETLDREFCDVIDALDLGLILPQAELNALDAAFQAVIDKLRALDPEQLVVEAVQPVFDAQVRPLVDAFDLTPVFDALIDALRNLDEELKAELGQVNTAYQALRAARPGASAATSSAASL